MLKESAEPVEAENPWQLCFIGDQKNPTASAFMQSIKALSGGDRRSAALGLEMLIKYAATGLPLDECYEKKACHPAFTFKYKGAEHKIWRIRKHEVRIYFYYVGGQVLLLPRVGEKREDKLTTAQKNEISAQVKEYLDANNKVQFKEWNDE